MLLHFFLNLYGRGVWGRNGRCLPSVSILRSACSFCHVSAPESRDYNTCAVHVCFGRRAGSLGSRAFLPQPLEVNMFWTRPVFFFFHLEGALTPRRRRFIDSYHCPCHFDLSWGAFPAGCFAKLGAPTPRLITRPFPPALYIRISTTPLRLPLDKNNARVWSTRCASRSRALHGCGRSPWRSARRSRSCAIRRLLSRPRVEVGFGFVHDACVAACFSYVCIWPDPFLRHPEVCD